jgi:hypothetical protein
VRIETVEAVYVDAYVPETKNAGRAVHERPFLSLTEVSSTMPTPESHAQQGVVRSVRICTRATTIDPAPRSQHVVRWRTSTSRYVPEQQLT